MKILVLGGCHTYAFGLNDINNGFLQKFLSNLKTMKKENIELTHFAPITIKVVNELIDKLQINFEEYDLVILQLGNYEFETKISHLYKLFKVESYKNNALNKPVFLKPLNDTITAERRAWYKEGFIYDPLVKLLRIFYLHY